MQVEITYMSAAGNLFAVIDNRDNLLENTNLESLAIKLCSKSTNGIMDTEGLMLLENSDQYDFDCKFYNPDGSTGMMCGNGGRAIVKFASLVDQIERNSRSIKFFMANDVYEAKFAGDNINLTMAGVKSEYEKQILIDNKTINTYFVDNGSQHAVININDLKIENLENLQIEDLGKKVRYNSAFEPNGANANFYSYSNEVINLRTYERGVEQETGACGTGAVATAIAANKNLGIDFPIRIIPTSGDLLTINLNKINGKKIYQLIGPAKVINKSKFEI
ncbi:MAG: diaminopimelate epimerase [Chlorobiota bacterium]